MPPQPLAPAAGQPDKRQQILSATLALLAKFGFHGFSIKQVAAEAGVAAGTIYLYFKDKQELIEQLHLDLMQEIAAAAFVDLPAGGGTFDQYRAICINLWGFCLNRPQLLFSKAQFDNLPPAVLHTQYSDAREYFKPLLDLLERGRQAGEVVSLPDDVLCALAIDPYWQLARRHHLGLVQVNDELLEQVIAAGWRAMKPPQAD